MVGLVENSHLHLAEVETTLLDKVFNTTGSRDDDIDTALKRSNLLVLGNATHDGRGEQANAASDGLNGAVDLLSELASRSQDEGAWLAAHLTVLATVVFHEALNEGRTESDGLARSGLSAAKNILAGENVGDGCCLNGERRLCTHGCELTRDVRPDTEVDEGLAFNLAGGNYLGFETLKNNIFLDLVRRLLVTVRVVGAFATLGALRALGAVSVRRASTTLGAVAISGTL